MDDDRRDVRFGLFLARATDQLDQTLELARAADASGLDLIGVQDHPDQQQFLDTWALMSTVLARTERITVFPGVADNVWGRITDGPSNDTFDGPVEQWVDTLTGLAVEGRMDAFVFGADGDDPVQMRRFVEEVAPELRRRVGDARGAA